MTFCSKKLRTLTAWPMIDCDDNILGGPAKVVMKKTYETIHNNPI